jgi:hypothetical protein
LLKKKAASARQGKEMTGADRTASCKTPATTADWKYSSNTFPPLPACLRIGQPLHMIET